MNDNDRIVVTGLGLMTGLGLDVATTWNGLLAGKSPVKRFSLFDPDGLSCTFGVELPANASELFTQIKTRNRSQMSRSTMIAVAAASQAIDDSGIKNASLDTTRIGAVIGSAGTGYDSSVHDEHRILKNMVSSPAAWLSLKWKFLGPCFMVSTACSSGAYALHSAYTLIRSGQCDCVIAGAADSSINYRDVEGFCSLMALSDETLDIASASRPFDKRRSGFVIGEGGAMMVVERESLARSRGAHIYAILAPPGLSSEAYNILSPETDGQGMARCMSLALDNAHLAPSQIDYINAHGTSTHLNDLYETMAIKKVFGNDARSLPVSSTKSLTGHCLGAAASIEAVICCKALIENTIPPTAHLTEPDPQLDLDYVPLTPRAKQLKHVMSNSFAFGGHNGVCVFSKYE